MNTLAPSLLIRSSSYLQVRRTSITSRKSSKFGQIGQRTSELAALSARLDWNSGFYGNRKLPSFRKLLRDDSVISVKYIKHHF